MNVFHLPYTLAVSQPQPFVATKLPRETWEAVLLDVDLDKSSTDTFSEDFTAMLLAYHTQSEAHSNELASTFLDKPLRAIGVECKNLDGPHQQLNQHNSTLYLPGTIAQRITRAGFNTQQFWDTFQQSEDR
ncbi:hypothetical protein RhiXN_02053 [Rhizoctonia solani]|uniref:Uncharacterized protein n=1 Tax=Rhizoctonia solani TaxID=456999 RepID=A0A8H8PC62_9AGAM|nr:uncharacterized protein RhiXN_02053 [Rhizoctonia solani]QRW27458.1 hypothetical protein RhiXN_02053 [Rhizoctonia solani]